MEATANEETPKRVPTEKNRGGVWVRFGDEEYRVPPIAFAAIEEFQERISTLQLAQNGMPSPAQMQVTVDVLHAALLRNYPSMQREDVKEMLDVGNFQAAMNAALSVSGFVKQSSGEGTASR